MAANERGQERGRNDRSGHKQRMSAAQRHLPKVDFEEMNFEVRRPPYNHLDGEAEDRTQGEPQGAERRREAH